MPDSQLEGIIIPSLATAARDYSYEEIEMQCSSCGIDCDSACVYVPNNLKRWEGGTLLAHFLRLLSGTKPKFSDLIQPMCHKCAKTYYIKYIIGHTLILCIWSILAIIFLFEPIQRGQMPGKEMILLISLSGVFFILLILNDYLCNKFGLRLKQLTDKSQHL